MGEVSRKEFMELKQRIDKLEKNKVKRHREPNEYNMYVKRKISELRKKHPNMGHQEIFKMAAQSWTGLKK